MSDPVPPTGNCFIDGLPDDDRAALAPILRPADLAAGGVLLRQDHRVHEVHFPIVAQLANVIRLEGGGGASTAIVGREGMSGLAAFMADEPCGWDVVVQAGGMALVASASDLRAVLDARSTLMTRMLALTHFYQLQAAQNVACAAQHSVRQRVARWMLTSADFSPGDAIRVTQEEISQLVGAQRTTVVAAARQLRTAGAIRYLRGSIRIIDRSRLEARACECYPMLKTKAERAGFLP